MLSLQEVSNDSGHAVSYRTVTDVSVRCDIIVACNRFARGCHVNILSAVSLPSKFWPSALMTSTKRYTEETSAAPHPVLACWASAMWNQQPSATHLWPFLADDCLCWPQQPRPSSTETGHRASGLVSAHPRRWPRPQSSSRPYRQRSRICHPIPGLRYGPCCSCRCR